MSDWWRGAVIYQIYPRSFQDCERRRHRRPARHHRAAALCRRPRRRCDLAVADLHLADGRHGLRRLGLHRHRPDLRHARRLRRAGRAGARARAQGHHRPGAVALLRPASRASRRAGRAATTPRPTGTSGPIPSTTARRRTTGSRSSAAAPGHGTPRRRQYYLHNFLAEQPDLNFHNPEVQDWLLGDDALLARARRRRLPPRHGQLLLPRQAAARRPGRLPRARTAPECQSLRHAVPHLLARTSRRTSPSSSACGRSSTSTRRAPWSARSARATTRIRMMGEYTTGGALHMCYSLRDARRPQFDRRAFPRPDRGVLRRRAGRLADAGPSPTTTCARHVTPLGEARHRPRAARQARRGAAPVARGLDLPLPGRGARARPRPTSSSTN